jgi:DNA modification methylase
MIYSFRIYPYGINYKSVNIVDCIVSSYKGKGAFIWQQSQEPALKLIERYTSLSYVVVDPFSGSGTFIFSAERLGGIGIDAEVKLG